MANIGEKEKALRALRNPTAGRDPATVESIREFVAKGAPALSVSLLMSPTAEAGLGLRPPKPKRDRRAYQRELMRKRRAAGKA